MTEKDGIWKREVTLDFDPSVVGDAKVAFIGRVSLHWSRGEYTKNLIEAHASDRASASVHVDVPYRLEFKGLEVCMKIWLILWSDRARRDITIQSTRHANETKGAFFPRDPVRPNPISIQAVTITEMNIETGELGISPTDAFDATPVLDIKPWREGIDTPPPQAWTRFTEATGGL